jgi:polysaccharide deacetylase family protein (PEP-CTERM system associated)
VVASTQALLKIFEETQNKATFFVLGWVAERQPALVREIAERGHEIACHGYGHQLVYEIGPERFREDLRRACGAIEDAVGIRPRGYRAPSYSITDRSLWALDILAEEGFEYDSSIFPIRHHRYGIPDFSRVPVRISLESGRSIREFPMTTLEAGPLRVPLAGGAYLRFFPPVLFRWGFRRLISAGDPIVLYVHPWEIDPDQPRQQVGWKVRGNHYYNLGRTEGRLARLLREFRFRPLEAVLAELESGSGLPAYAFSEGGLAGRGAGEWTASAPGQLGRDELPAPPVKCRS